MANNFKIARKPRKYSIDYNDEQLQALEMLIDWTYSPLTKDSLFYTLEGAAGTGKTTILKDFINNCKYKGNICATAPTHKAVRVIEETTKLTSNTIQKLLGLRPNLNLENYDINNPTFDPIGNKYIANYSLIIIDEASMINSNLRTTLENEAEKGDTRLLYVGDSYQLPPVKETYSTVFKNKNKIIITKVMRQDKDNPLLQLLGVIRRDIKNNTLNFINDIRKFPTKSNDNGNGYYLVNKDNFQKSITSYFSSGNFEKNIDYCRYTAWTNDNILSWNTFIRSVIFPDNNHMILHKDDLLTSYNTIVDEFNAPILVNSDDYVIGDINNYINKYDIHGYIVRFQSILTGNFSPYKFIVDHSVEHNKQKFLKVFFTYLDAAKNASKNVRYKEWKNYYNFKENNLLLVTIKDKNGREIVKKDLDYGYGLTIHKTQGSTYNNIFVNVANILKGNTIVQNSNSMIARLAYVAMSRAKEKCIIFV